MASPRLIHTEQARKGFTMIELIVVIAIIAIVASAVFVAIDPARRLHSARNSTRWTDTRAILEAMKKYQADNDGDLPSSATAVDSDETSVQLIGNGGLSCGSVSCDGVTIASANCFASALDTDLQQYLKNIPEDPKTGDSADTRYYVNIDDNGFIVVGACDEEGEDAGGGGTSPVISVSR